MFEISEGMITVYIKTYPGFEYEYVEEIQADLLQCLNMTQLMRKVSDLDNFPKGTMESVVQLMESFHFTADDIRKSHPMTDTNEEN